MIKKYYNKTKNYYSIFLKTKTAKSYGIILSGNMVTALLGLVASVLIARFLGPGDFGLFSTVLALQLVVGTIVDFGFSKGFVTLLAKQKYRDFYPQIFASGFYFRLSFCALAALLGIVSAEFVSNSLFKNIQFITPLRVGYMVMFFGGIWGILQLGIQASERFKIFAISKVITAIIKLGVLLGLFHYAAIDINKALIAYLASFALGACYSFIYTNKDYFSLRLFKLDAIKQLLRFNQWIVYVNGLYIVSNRLGIFMLASMAGALSAGIYYAAFALINGIALTLESISIVLLPQVSNINSHKKLKEYLLKCFSISLPLVFCCIVGIFLSKPVILLVYGVEYHQSFLVLVPFLIWLMVSLVADPLVLLSYGINRPDIVFYSNLVNFVLLICFNLYLIPLFGAPGAAYSMIISKVVSSMINIAWIFYEIKGELSEGRLEMVSSVFPKWRTDYHSDN